MWRLLFLSIALLLPDNLQSLAGEPGLITIVVTDPRLAAKVSAKVPGLRVGVLEIQADEPDEVINARAVAWRNATHLLFDHSTESLRSAMFRERLQMHGVVAINIRSNSLQRPHSGRSPHSPSIELIANLLTHSSSDPAAFPK